MTVLNPRQRSLAEREGRVLIANAALQILPERVTVDARPVTAPELRADIEAASHYPDGFKAWARHWHFKNRESGQDHTFAIMWPGQEAFADLMTSWRCGRCERVYAARPSVCDACGNTDMFPAWIFALKAGKLGFTELECCWDGYVAWARRNGRVHLFSKEEGAAKEMLTYVLYGLRSLEPAWGVRFVEREGRPEIPWSRVATQTLYFIVQPPDSERDYSDTRTIQAYATSKNPAIDKTAHHAHVDEWAHMEHPEDVWSSVGTTVSPDGSCHIVTRGNGENPAVEKQWADARAGTGKLKAYFADWTKRPGRDQAWLSAEASTLRTVAAISHFAPETPEDAFIGDEDNDFVDITWWDACFDPTLARWIPDASGQQRNGEERGRWVGSMQPGDTTPMVLALDAGVSHDNFGVTGATRHPERHDDPALRLARLWRPEDFEDGIIEFGNVQSWLRMICQGGCRLGHPVWDPAWQLGKNTKRMVNQAWEPGACPACQAILDGREQMLPAYNVIQICYDPHQLADMGQSMRRDGVAWMFAFEQGKPRLQADKTFYDVIVNRRLGHMGDWRLREHVGATKAKTQKDEESKIRMVKKAQHRRIDLAVSAAMAVDRILYLQP